MTYTNIVSSGISVFFVVCAVFTAGALAAVNGGTAGTMNDSTGSAVTTGNTSSSGNAVTTRNYGGAASNGVVNPAVNQTGNIGQIVPNGNINGSSPDSGAARGINSADTTGLRTNTLNSNGEVIRTDQSAPVVVPALPANR